MFSSLALLGAKRQTLNAKQGNKNFYKGNRSGRMGHWTVKGRFIVDQHRLREFVCPANLGESNLKPFVSPQQTKVERSHTVADYFAQENWTGEQDREPLYAKALLIK
ncbi:mitochondrial ribosomal protein L27-domain-containing protein [Gorgonomyces haynaldii]|nr:mitochondrial ribosomal protein L27-domain-containing protein [Gorgonomyces haynaldii]